MAGEWLKFDASTPEKPEVLAITIAMGWEDPDLTVGKLLRVWRWFDQQTVKGNAPGVSASLLDRLLGVTGLCSAMESVGWLIVSESGLTLPNFDRHNGKTAKDRALTAKRVANHKSRNDGNDETNAPIVSSALPREEKRREEKKTPGPRKRGDGEGRFPEFWAAWPSGDRKQDRKRCLGKWERCGFDADADAILAHVEISKASRKWRDGFEPAPLTYLNGERWKDGGDLATVGADTAEFI